MSQSKFVNYEKWGNGIFMFIIAIKSILYEYACLIFLCIIFQMLMVSKELTRGHKYNLKHFIWVYIFLLYLMLVFICTGTGNIRDIGRYPTVIRLDQINLVPFNTYSGGIITHIANIIMFTPLGFLLPLIWKQFKSARKVAFTGLLFSLLIELSQLLNMRCSDIDDLIMNTAGAFLGWVLFNLFEKLFKMKDKKQVNNIEISKMSFLAYHEACFYLILSFAGEFLFFNEFLFIK